jgi:hypothetical protein
MKKPIFLLLVLFAACSNQGGQEQEEAMVVPAGKADNFLAPKAQEYIVEGTTTVTIESDLSGASEEEKLKRVRELIPLKQIVIGWFLNKYVGPKSHDDDSDYGDFESLTKNGSYEDMDIQDTGDGLTYSFKLRQEIGGTMDLLAKLPTQVDADGRHHFTLIVGKISNDEMDDLETNHEWYRRDPWSDFDPKNVDAFRLEEVDLVIQPEPRSVDAWIDYAALFKDGQVTIAAHFGWDYHGEYHLKHSEDVYNWLTNRGFDSPVGSYAEYTRTSGPLTKTVRANGRSVTVKVWLFWGQPGTDTDPDTYAGGVQLEDDMKASFKDREVIIFSGHSGPFYGFALANWRKTDAGDLDDSEIAALDMPAGVYQVVLAEGCETYALGQAFFNNPNKSDREYLDVITTTSFSNASTASTVTDFLTTIVGNGFGGESPVEATTYMELLKDLDGNSRWFATMYGIHGIDNNPHLHPYVDESVFCKSCERDRDCGPEGYKCARLNPEEKSCFGRCTANDGCPRGWKCMDIASGSYLQWKGCVPANLTCTTDPPQPDIPTVMINEVLADPPPDLAGDANGDGVQNSRSDEFVEIYNYGQNLVDLGGFLITDNTGTRFVFPTGATLMSGEAAVVFGGGEPAGSFGGSVIHVTDNTLGLNNTGDTITLVAPDGTWVDRLTYTRAEGGQDRSMVRETDGDPESAFVQHPGEPFSAGTKQDQTPF